MEQNNPILCPYCGAEMEMIGFDKFWYTCPKCAADSPFVEGKQEAYAAAQRRYVPPIKPLTLEEALVQRVVYVDWKNNGAVVDSPILLHMIWDEWSEQDILAWESFGVEGEYDPPATDYNRTWRCWSRRPTDEERMDAAWEVE